jgi:hypothetical protein
MPELSGEWIAFNQLEGGDAYYPAFKKRTIDRVVKKFGASPVGLFAAAERMGGTRTGKGDAGVVIPAFAEVPLAVTVWKADEEFSPNANILFDKTVSRIFCTEDIVVLSEIVVHSL